MMRVLTIAVAIFLVAGMVDAGEHSVTHIVKKGAAIGVKTFKTYKDWPHVEVHVKPDNKTVKFDGSPSWKMSHRSEYLGWVLQVPKDSKKAREVLKQEHYWRGSEIVGRRVDTGVRGHYYLVGGGGKAGKGGRAAGGKLPIWTVLSLDCDIDVDSNRDRKVDSNNFSKTADEEDKLEHSAKNPVGAIVCTGDLREFVIRRIWPERLAHENGPALSSLIEGRMYVRHINADRNRGKVRLVVRKDEASKDGLLVVLEDALAKDASLKPEFWKKLVAGEDLHLLMQGLQPGRVELRAKLSVRRKGSKGKPAEFWDDVNVLVTGVSVVPAVDLNGKKFGHGAVPAIPMNASLSKKISGTGRPKEVVVTASLTAPPGSYVVKIVPRDYTVLSISGASRLDVPITIKRSDASNNFTRIGTKRATIRASVISRKSTDASYLLANVSIVKGVSAALPIDGVTGILRYKVIGRFAVRRPEFVGQTLKSFTTKMTRKHSIPMVRPKNKQDATTKLEKPHGTLQLKQTNRVPGRAYNVYTTESLGTGSTAKGSITMGASSGETWSGFKADVKCSGASACDWAMSLQFSSQPAGVARGAVMDADISLRRKLHAELLADSDIIWPRGGSSVGVSLGPLSFSQSFPGADYTSAAGLNEGLLIQDSTGTWRPHRTGDIPTGDITSLRVATKSVRDDETFRKWRSTEIDGMRAAIDTDSFAVLQVLAAGATGKLNTAAWGTDGAWAKVFVKVMSAECVIRNCSIRSLGDE
jgi:hypothetical protein